MCSIFARFRPLHSQHGFGEEVAFALGLGLRLPASGALSALSGSDIPPTVQSFHIDPITLRFDDSDPGVQ